MIFLVMQPLLVLLLLNVLVVLCLVLRNTRYKTYLYSVQFLLSVVLRPAVNEFRLKGLPRQSPETKPPTEIIPLAEEVISKLPAPTLYARVDMMLNPSTNKYEVSELEIIEPGLYLTTSDQGLALFINGILRRIGSQPERA